MPVPPKRIRTLTAPGVPVRAEGSFVLYWMIAFRRTRYNFALQRSVEWAQKLGKPLVVFEPLRAGYPWANDRFHRFIIEGMQDNLRALAKKPVTYFPYLERRPGEGKGLLHAWSARACVVVTDDHPGFFYPRMTGAAAEKMDVPLEAVDSNGLVPIAATPRFFQTAASFRTFLAKHLAEHLPDAPDEDPLRAKRLPKLVALPRGLSSKWPSAVTFLSKGSQDLKDFEIDHSVPFSPMRGGMGAAQARLKTFLEEKLPRYADERSDPGADMSSRLSPYLHFGQLSEHEVVARIAKKENKSELKPNPRGKRRQLFGLSESAEVFLDELVTWRELAFNLASRVPEHQTYDSLPRWSRKTLEEHAGDVRPRLKSPEALEAGTTGDVLYDAAQRQLLQEGWFHNRVRMIWGKKLLEYTESPQAAFQTMAYLMNKYSLDGRDPNSWSNFSWVLGRYDRPWGPERPIFGKVRYMSSDTPTNLRRYRTYLEQYLPSSTRATHAAAHPER